jgi:hypothetical protein
MAHRTPLAVPPADDARVPALGGRWSPFDVLSLAARITERIL